MKKFLPTLILLGASMTIATPYAVAQGTPAATQKSAQPAAKKAAPKKPAAKKPAAKLNAADPKEAADHEDGEPDVTGSISVDFQCELGNKLTIYENIGDDKHIALQWKKRLHRLTRVNTSTGANRFENRRHGLVWIGIPAKGMLLDSKKGQQLANECKNAEQSKQKAVTAGTPGLLSAPATPEAAKAPAEPVKAEPGSTPSTPESRKTGL